MHLINMEIIEVGGVSVPIGNHEGKTIIIGADHNGFAYKQKLIDIFKRNGYKVVDVGTNSDEVCDYPGISNDIGKRITSRFDTVGICISGSGNGILIPASRYRGVYGARCINVEDAKTARSNFNSNLLSIGTAYSDFEATLAIIETWLKTQFYRDQDDTANLNRYVQMVLLERRF